MKVVIETIPHAQQQYPTVGDWRRDADGTLHIYVSEMGHDDYHALVAVHELVEVLLCEKRGITLEAVDAFDKTFEARRPLGNVDEPGDDPEAPYHREHCFATGVERLMASALGVPWKDYEDTVNLL